MDKKLLSEDITLDNIHTLSSDTIEAIEEQKITQAKLIARREQEEEQLRREREYRQQQAKAGRTYKVRNILIMLAVAVALFGLALGILHLVNKESQGTPVTPTQAEDTLVLFDAKKEIVFSLAEVRSAEDFKNKLLLEGTPVSGGVTYYKTDPVIQGVVTILSPGMSEDLLRGISDMFWGGQSAGNFLVVKVESYERAYAGMLEWEATAGKDLAPLFGSAPTSTAVFSDKVVANKDTRIAHDGKTALFLYGFYNQNIIIFAKNEEVFKSVYDSLLRQNL